MNLIDFIRAGANFLVLERPDIYNVNNAADDLAYGIDMLRDDDNDLPSNTLMFTSFCLQRIVSEPGVEEFVLSRKIASAVFFEGEDGCLVYGHTDKIDLPGVLDSQGDDEVD